jgi:hypothetical protein
MITDTAPTTKINALAMAPKNPGRVCGCM